MSNLLIKLLLIGLVAGVTSGLFGVGGGAILVPAMVTTLHLDQKLATGTSLAAQLLPIGILGAGVYYESGRLNIKYAGIIAIGMVVGSLFGAMFANQTFISSQMMKKLYGGYFLAIALRYLIR